MTVKIRPESGRALLACLRWTCWLALLGAAILLGWPTAVLLDSQMAQWSGARELERQTQAAASPQQEQIVPESTVESKTSTKAPGDVVGRLEISRLKMSYIVLEGTDKRTLDRSIGHVRTTALPGEMGNIAIAGHRNTHFRQLEWIRRDDEIVLTSPQGAFRYRVEWVSLFQPSQLQVLDPSHGPALTLITCFPFEYVGSAPLRFVVRALPDEQTRSRLEAMGSPRAVGD